MAKNSLILDFSHADPNHTCPGVDACPELVQARRDMGLERDAGRSLVGIVFVLSCLVVYVGIRRNVYFRSLYTRIAIINARYHVTRRALKKERIARRDTDNEKMP
jgi:hypothetical protein